MARQRVRYGALRAGWIAGPRSGHQVVGHYYGEIMRYLLLATGLALSSVTPPVLSKGNQTKPPLNQAELRQCVSLDDDMERQRKAYNVQVRESNDLVKQQGQIRGELDQMKMAIEAGESFRMDAYNAKIEEHNEIGERHDEYKLRMAEISETQRLAAEQYNRTCAGRTFLNADLLKIKRPKK